MKLISIHIRNFLSHVDTKLNFTQGLSLIDGYNFDEETANGSGKSTLLDAICFALYGIIPRDVKLDEVVHKDAEKGCKIDLHFEVQDREYHILRQRKPNKLYYSRNNEAVEAADNKELQAKIEKDIGISYATFVRSVYYPQDSDVADTFLFANDTARKEVLTELLELEIFDRASEECKELLRNNRTKAETQSNTIDNDIVRRKSVIDNLVEYQQQSSSFEERQASHVKELEADVDREKQRFVAAQKAFDTEYPDVSLYNKSTEDLSSIEQDIRARYVEPITELKKDIEDIEAKIGVTSEKITELNLTIRNCDKELLTFVDMVSGVPCPSCRRQLLDEDVVRLTGTLKERKETAANQLPAHNDDIKNLRELLKEQQQKMQKLEMNRNNEITLATVKAKQYKKDFDKLQELATSVKNNIGDKRERLKLVSEQTNEFVALIQSAQENLEIVDRRIEEGRLILTKLQEAVAALEWLDVAFGRQGVKAAIFVDALQELTVYVNDYLRQLFVEDMRLTISSEKVTGTGSVSQSITISLLRNGQESNLHLLSGGERRRVILAMDFAISKLVSNRARMVPNFACLDECFNGLDSAGKECVMSFLRNLSAQKDFVWVIDHSCEVKESFDQVLFVEKRNGVSSLRDAAEVLGVAV